jgi:uncharacterized membrane protein YeaQ/YmgE (transglycosylase-associated protein family)
MLLCHVTSIAHLAPDQLPDTALRGKGHPQNKALCLCGRRHRDPVPLQVNDWEVVMGIIGWIVLGLIAGAIAKAILPGTQGGGWIITLILGVVGALLGGFLGGLLFPGFDMNTFFSLSTWVAAIVGSIIVLLIYGLVTRGSRRA